MKTPSTLSFATIEYLTVQGSMRSVLPSWLYNYSFIFLNLSSANIMAGTTLILLIRLWNATGAEIGRMLSLIPAAQIVRLFVAPSIERIGVSRFVFTGLTDRNVFHLSLCMLSFWATVGGRYEVLKWLFVVLIFFFNIAQSFGFAGWVPCMWWLVKETHRGRFLALF